MNLTNKKRKSRFKLVLALLAFLMAPYSYAGELSPRNKDISPLYAGALCLLCCIVLFVNWYQGK